MKKELLVAGVIVTGLGVLFLAYKLLKKDVDTSDPELVALIKKIENAKK
jgi:hypothetical protein